MAAGTKMGKTRKRRKRRRMRKGGGGGGGGVQDDVEALSSLFHKTRIL